jgi:hypothetical protein
VPAARFGDQWQIDRQARRQDHAARMFEPAAIERIEFHPDSSALAPQYIEPGRCSAAVDHEHGLAASREMPGGGQTARAKADDERAGGGPRILRWLVGVSGFDWR